MYFSPSNNVPVLSNINITCDQNDKAIILFNSVDHNIYTPITACDGQTAYQQLSASSFEAIVSVYTPTNLQSEISGMTCQPNCVGEDYYNFITNVSGFLERDTLSWYVPQITQVTSGLATSVKDTVFGSLVQSLPLITAFFVFSTIFILLLRWFRKHLK